MQTGTAHRANGECRTCKGRLRHSVSKDPQQALCKCSKAWRRLGGAGGQPGGAGEVAKHPGTFQTPSVQALCSALPPFVVPVFSPCHNLYPIKMR